MPFPINPLALVDKPSVLGVLWGNLSVHLPRVKENQITCKQYVMCELQMGLMALCQGASVNLFLMSFGLIWILSTVRLSNYFKNP